MEFSKLEIFRIFQIANIFYFPNYKFKKNFKYKIFGIFKMANFLNFPNYFLEFSGFQFFSNFPDFKFFGIFQIQNFWKFPKCKFFDFSKSQFFRIFQIDNKIFVIFQIGNFWNCPNQKSFNLENQKLAILELFVLRSFLSI